LWTLDLIEQGRRAQADIPPMKRIVVAIDPAISTGEDSDETGIVVVGLGTDGHGYVLEDASGKYSPIEWARRAVALYRKWNADRIVAEANQGGQMLETTIRTVDQNVSFKAVHASKGKITRAEPVAPLAEQFRIHHVGVFPALEDQLCTFEAGSPDSPDRLDALVWGVSELMVGFQPASVICPPILIGLDEPRYFPHSDRYLGGGAEARAAADPRQSGFTISGPDWPSPLRRNF
jgi:predicted phage terminase large subunit-like protein